MGNDEVVQSQNISAKKTITNINNRNNLNKYKNVEIPNHKRMAKSPESQYKKITKPVYIEKQPVDDLAIKKTNFNSENEQKQSFISNITIKKRDFNCTKNKTVLINDLNTFLSQINFQNQSFEKKKDLNDPVFESIQKEEMKELSHFFMKNKDTFINEILNYLNLNKTNFNPNLTQTIINSENGYEVYRTKIQNIISNINNENRNFQIEYLTVMLLGKSGVGKTTLINKILGINAPTGEGSFITTKTTPYKSNAMPFLRLVDTRGIELSQNFGAAQLQIEAMNFITEQIQTKNYNNFVHCIWYCITTKRFEKVEVEILKRIRNTYQSTKIPIIIVYTQSVDKLAITKMKNYILGQIDCNDFVEILAEDIVGFGDNVLKSFGIDKLINQTLIRCKEALNGDMRSVMTTQISERIQNDLINENNRIKSYIYEKMILNLIKGGFNIQDNENFIKSLITLYGYNSYYFLNKIINDQTSSMIKNDDILRNNIIYYIKFYQEKTNSLISNELNNFVLKLLNLQAKKEQELGRPTLMHNKRNADDFIVCIKQYLYDNFYCLAQKYYIGNFIIYTYESLTKTFEDNFNQITYDLLNRNEVKVLIEKCFLKKYQQFEERIIKTQKNISLNQNALMANPHVSKKQVANNNYIYPQFSSTNGRSPHVSKKQIAENKHIYPQFSSMNGRTDLSSLSYSSKKNPYSDIKSVTTIDINSHKY